MNNQGMVYVFTGEGKGKTSAALGVTIRALLSSWEVCWISFYKSNDWELSEKRLTEKFDNLEMYWTGEGFHIEDGKRVSKDVKIVEVGGKGNKVVDSASENEHKVAAKKGLELAKEKVNLGKYKLVVLDEINNAIDDGLLNIEDVLGVINGRENVHLVLTGRNVRSKIIEMSDLVTDCTKVKHPYDEGKLAVKGLDY